MADSPIPAPAAELSPLKRALLALEKMQARLDALEGEKREPIAVLGIGCRFPGGVNTPAAFWQLLLEGRDAVGHFPDDRPGSEAWKQPSLIPAISELIRHGGYLSDVESFDPGFFGISPREAMRMDPQQRMLLLTSCEALEAAGLPLEKLAGTKAGVFVGIHSQSSDYYQLQTSAPEEMDTYTSTGSAHSIVANRLSYALDLRGPSMVVDTACSSSLVALHLACQSLRLRESSIALAGGVNLILAPETSLAFSRLEFLSVDGRSKTFDASANGFVRAEGCGIIVLKRLSEALRDGDPVLAVIRGTALNQDGTTNGLTAPNGLSQQAVIRAALENGRVDPANVTLLETHGTGTSLGDPIEVDALRSVYSPTARRALGALKSNIGHTEAAAGIAGVIKTVLALQHRTIPRNLHFRALNPHINLEGSQFFVPVATTPWESPSGPRYASVSSFGFGGTNGHVILQEAPATSAPTPGQGTPARSLTQLVPLAARSEPALKALLERWRHFLGDPAFHGSLEDVCFTAGARRSHHPVRLAVVAGSMTELRARIDQLASGEDPAGTARGSGAAEPPRVAFVLCGQGPQWWAMGRELLETEPVFRDSIQRCSAEMARHVTWNLLEELARPESASRLNETEFAQPALFAIQLALAALWQSWGIEPHALVGHSVGEVAAAHLGGALSLADAVKVICHRGRIMQAATGLGRMAAIDLPEAEVSRLIVNHRPVVAVAAVNSPTSTVVSGATDVVTMICEAARNQGARTKVLPVNYAFHSPQMEPFRAQMAAAVTGIEIRPLTIPVYATVSGRLATASDFDADYWGSNIREPVRFAPAIHALLHDEIDVFIEIGPQPVLAAMIAQCADADAKKVTVLASLRANQPERTQLLESLAALYVRGAAITWSAVAPRDGRIVPLPAYPWQMKQLWLEPATTGIRAATAGAAQAEASTPAHGTRLRSPGLSGIVFERWFRLASAGFIRDHVVFSKVLVPAPVLIEMVLGGAAEAFPANTHAIKDMVLHRALRLDAKRDRCVHVVFTAPQDGVYSFTIHSRGPVEGNEPTWILHASGRVAPGSTQPPAEAGKASPQELAALRARLSEELSPDMFYESFARRGVAFGPAFQVVTKLQLGGGETLTELKTALAQDAGKDYHHQHPVLWDAALQAIAVGRNAAGPPASSPNELHLFCGFDELRTDSAGASHVFCHTWLDPVEDRARGVFRGNVRMLAETGEVIAEITGARFQCADRETVFAAYDQQPESLFHEVVWKTQSNARAATATASTHEASSPAASAPTPTSWLVIGDNSTRCDSLIEQLKTLGHAHAVASLAECERSLAGTLAGMSAPCRNVVLIAASDRDHASIDTLRTSDEVTALVTNALAAAQVLIRTTSTPRPRLWFVTRDSQPAGRSSVTNSPPAVLWGLGRVLAVEHPEIWGGLVDLDATGIAAEDAALLIAQIEHHDGEDQCAFRGGTRYVPRLVAQTARNGAPVAWKSDGCYIVTGGLGGLGLHIARWLAAQGARRIVLIGRTPLPPRDQWSQLASGSRAAEQVGAIREIEKTGASVRTLAVDIAGEKELADGFAELRAAGWSTAHGVVHAAGAIEDRLVSQLDRAGISTALRPKVLGTLNLERCLAGQPLDFFVCFSSLGSLMGVAGQANYAAANAFLDAFAHSRRAHGLPVFSINWGGWSGAGLALSAGGKRTIASLEQRGILEFTPAEGVAALELILRRPAVQTTVIGLDEEKFRCSYPAGEEPPLLRELVPASSRPASVPTADQGRAQVREEVLALEAGPKRREFLTAHLTSLVACTLKLEPAAIDPEKPLGAMGLDSLMSFELKNRCERSFGLNLSATMAWNYPTVVAMTDFLAGKMGISLTEEASPEAAPDRPADTAAAPILEELSDEQALRSLRKRRHSV